MCIYTVCNRLPVWIKVFRDIPGLHTLSKITEEFSVCLPRQLLFMILQPLESGPFIFYPLRFHVFSASSDNDHNF